MIHSSGLKSREDHASGSPIYFLPSTFPEREAREKLERILEERSAEVEALKSLIERIIKEKLEA